MAACAVTRILIAISDKYVIGLCWSRRNLKKADVTTSALPGIVALTQERNQYIVLGLAEFLGIC